MSYYQQTRGQRPTIGQDGNTLTMLIAVNLTVFILLSFIKVIYYFTNGTEGVNIYQDKILYWVTLPANLELLLTRPWTLITHMFVHNNVWHIISNMLWLWCFGYILEDLTGTKKIIPIFIYGALAGALAYIIAYNVIPPLQAEIGRSTALGASAGVMAVAIATTVLAPGYRIFPFINGGIPLWVITMIFVIIDLATIPYNNAGGHIAHLAGAGMGMLFVAMMRKGKDWGAWMNNFFDWVTNLFNPDKPKRGRAIRSQQFYKSNIPPFKKKPNVTQQKGR